MPSLTDFVRGATFDDFLFTPQYSVIERRDPNTIDLSSRLSEHLMLKRPIVDAKIRALVQGRDLYEGRVPARVA